MPYAQSKDSRQVNSLLHNLRGEQFRHLQNVKGSRDHISALWNYNSPSLPIRLANLEHERANLSRSLPPTVEPIVQSGSGPAPSSSNPESSSHESLSWRRQALSLVAAHLDGFPDLFQVPSLVLLCLQIILSNCSSSAEFREDVVPFIPYHLRRDLVRYCAIHSPLPTWKLDALFEPHGHADGEILVVGPEGSLRESHFLHHVPDLTREAQDESNWEAEDNSPSSLHTVVLLSPRLSTATLLTIPPTLTTLALIGLTSSVPLHRLPKICPLLVFLDLSYNAWLQEPVSSDALNSFERVEWTRWGHLKVLGLRGCHMSDEVIRKINQGRWDDVEVVC